MYRAEISGELSCFANDVGCAYGNNKGSIELEVEELGVVGPGGWVAQVQKARQLGALRRRRLHESCQRAEEFQDRAAKAAVPG